MQWRSIDDRSHAFLKIRRTPKALTAWRVLCCRRCSGATPCGECTRFTKGDRDSENNTPHPYRSTLLLQCRLPPFARTWYIRLRIGPARRTLGRARSLCAVKLKMSWRAAVARHSCTTHRNRAPCERDQNCAWVNPHPRGARFKHKLLNVFTRDVEDPGGRCESKRASHATLQRHASPSPSSSETDLSSEPESVSPGPPFSATTSDDEGGGVSPRGREHLSSPQTQGGRSEDRHPGEPPSTPRAVASHDHAGGLGHHVVPDASDASAPEMPAHGLDAAMSMASASLAQIDRAPIAKSGGSLPSPRPGEESEESDSEASEHAGEKQEFHNLSMAERRRRAEAALKQSTQRSHDRPGKPIERQFKFKVPDASYGPRKPTAEEEASLRTASNVAAAPRSTVADKKKIWEDKLVAAPPLRPGGLALK